MSAATVTNDANSSQAKLKSPDSSVIDLMGVEINTDPKKCSIALIVILIMQGAAFIPTEQKISDIGEEQNGVADVQGNVSQIENAINNALKTVDKDHTSGVAPGPQVYQTLANEIQKLFQGGGEGTVTWANAKFWVDGKQVPLLVKSGGGYVGNPELAGFGQIIDALNKNVTANGLGTPFAWNPWKIPLSSTDAEKTLPSYLQKMVPEFQYMIDSPAGMDIIHDNPGASTSELLTKLWDSTANTSLNTPTSSAMLSSLNTLLASLGQTDPGSGLNALAVVQEYLDSPAEGEKAMTALFTSWMSEYYQNKFVTAGGTGSNSSAPAGGQSLGTTISTNASQVGTMASQLTQTLTADIQKMMTDLQSFDQTGSTIVQGFGTMINTITSNTAHGG